MNMIVSEVLRTGPSRFNMVGQKLPSSLSSTEEIISPGLVHRLYRYARTAITKGGFDITSWRCRIYTMDAELRPPERAYVVEFCNSLGGKIGIQGILTHRGHPCVDHGVFAEIEDPSHDQ